MLMFKKCKYIVIRLVLRVLCNKIVRTNNIYEVFSMKVSFNHFKLTRNFISKKTLPKISKSVVEDNYSKALPLLTFPLVAYYIGEGSDQALARLIKKMKDLGIDIPSNYSSDPSTNAGLDFASQGKFRDAINKAAKNGDIDSYQKNDLLNKVSFTGKDDSDYGVYDGNNDDGCCDCDSDDDCCDSDSDCDSGDALLSSC